MVCVKYSRVSVVKLGSSYCLLHGSIRYFIMHQAGFETQQGCAQCKLFLSTCPIYFCIHALLQSGSPYWGYCVLFYKYVHVVSLLTCRQCIYFHIIISDGFSSLGLRCSVSFIHTCKVVTCTHSIGQSSIVTSFCWFSFESYQSPCSAHASFVCLNHINVPV